MRKVGRNDPCPCGSGKKFKKCHLGRSEELFPEGMSEISEEASRKITELPRVSYGQSGEMLDSLDIQELTGSSIGIKFVDLKKYRDLDLAGYPSSMRKKEDAGGVLVNVLKTSKTDPDNIYVAIAPGIGESALVHQMAHVLDYLGGSRLMPGVSKALAFELGIPTEHLEHPHEFAYWLDYLSTTFGVQLDADDRIILYLYEHGMLIRGEYIEKQDQFVLKSKSDRMLRFLSERSAEIDEIICELPGYIGSRVKED